MKTHRITLYRNRRGEWMWRLQRIRGGKIIADSAEGYRRKVDARRQIATLFQLDAFNCDVVEKA